MTDLMNLPLADMAISKLGLTILEDFRHSFGYVLVQCPNDDGSDDHALHLTNASPTAPALAYCLSPRCASVDAHHFVDVLKLCLDT
jgi:hypothetical protein